MAKEIRRYELALDTDEEEAGLMKARMRVEEAQRIRREQEEAAPSAATGATRTDTGPASGATSTITARARIELEPAGANTSKIPERLVTIDPEWIVVRPPRRAIQCSRQCGVTRPSNAAAPANRYGCAVRMESCTGWALCGSSRCSNPPRGTRQPSWDRRASQTNQTSAA